MKALLTNILSTSSSSSSFFFCLADTTSRMQQTVLRCQITFAIRYNTIPGQIIAVMGNVEALGGWDVRKAHRMEYVCTPNETEPNWKLTLSIPVGLLRHSLRLEYK